MKEETTNSYILKITGSNELPDKLEADKSLKVSLDVDIYEVAKKDNFDGTFDIIYKAKSTGAAEVIQGDVKMRGKDKKRWSQKLRAILYIDAKNSGEEDYSIHYDLWMNKICQNWELIKEFLKDK